MRRIGIGVFLITILCSIAFAAPTPYGGQIVIAIYDEPTSLNPLNVRSGAAVLIQSAFSNGLVKQDENGNDLPDLAESWEISADGLTWTFHLKKGARFSDGTDVTADDVAATFQEAMNPGSPSSGGLLTQLVKELKSDGKDTFQVILKTPYSLLAQTVQRAIMPAWAIAGDASAKKRYDERPIGTGPFMIAEWTRNQIILDANPSYFEGRPHLDRIIYRRFPDQKQAWASLMQGDIDMVVDVDYEDYRIIKDDPRFKAYDYLDTFCYPLLFNLKDPLFSQPRIRQAISLAIDRQDLVDKALQGGGIAITGPFQPGTWAYNPDPSIQPFDPGKASAILKDLGWKDTDGDWILEREGKKLQFTLAIDQNDKLKEATVKRLQWQLLQIGARMDVEILPFPKLMEERLSNATYQATIMQENSFGNPDIMSSYFWHSSSIGRFNLPGYSNPEVDRLIAAGKSANNSSKKSAIYQQLHRLIADDAPAAFLYYRKRYTAMTARLGGFRTGAVGLFNESMSQWFVTK